MKKTQRAFASLLVLASILSSMPAQGATEGKKVNINSADAAQLSMLPRVGPSVAQRVLDYRKQNGSFKKPEDLMLVRGIGEKTFQLIKPYVAISGETTLKEKVKGAHASSDKESPGKSPGKEKEKKEPQPHGKDAR